jgi:hypothetical protein
MAVSLVTASHESRMGVYDITMLRLMWQQQHQEVAPD